MSKDRIGNLAIIISGDAKNYMEVMAGVEQHLAAAQARMEAKSRNSQLNPFGHLGSYVKAAAAAYVTGRLGSEMIGVGRNAIQLASDLEVSEKQLKTLTGSAAAARDVMEDLRNFAAATPFDVGEISSVARKLMGGGMSRNDSLRATKQIAAVGAGTGGELSSLGRAYSQVMANGRFMTEELNQFSDADFPIAEFAKTYGSSMGQLRDDMSKGLVPVSVMTDTFTRLTAEGGKFATALKDMADTMSGRAKVIESQHNQRLAAAGKLIGESVPLFTRIGNFFEESAASVEAIVTSGFNLNGADFDLEKQRAEIAADKKKRDDAYIARQTDHQSAREHFLLFLENGGLQKRFSELTESAKSFLSATSPQAQAFRRGDVPEWASHHGGLRKAMEWGDLDAAAKIVKGMQESQGAQSRFRFAPALTRGSQEAEQVLSRAMESVMGPKMGVKEAIDETNRLLAEEKRELERIKDEIKNLITPAARF
jgi:tape measure domain-containing protein